MTLSIPPSFTVRCTYLPMCTTKTVQITSLLDEKGLCIKLMKVLQSRTVSDCKFLSSTPIVLAP